MERFTPPRPRKTRSDKKPKVERPPLPRGRPPGAKNKTTSAVKEALTLAFQGLGGVDRLIEWANTTIPIYGPSGTELETTIIGYKGNYGEFAKLWAKLLPVQITGEGDDGTIKIVISQADSKL